MNPFDVSGAPAPPAPAVRPAPTPYCERRRDTRRPHSARAILTVLDGLDAGASHEITTRDLSGSGICFLLKTGLAVGQTCRIEVPKPEGRPVVHLCEVVRSRLLSNGKYEMGVTFERPLRA